MTKLKTAALAVVGLIALTGCQQRTDSAAFEAQAREDLRAWFSAVNAGDVDALVAKYAPDAEIMAPANPRASGHDAIRALFEKLTGEMQAGGVTLALNDDDEAAASGDIGWQSGSYAVRDSSGAAVDGGNFLAVMQRQADGKWLLIRDTWNSDRPPPAPPAAEAEAAPAAEKG